MKINSKHRVLSIILSVLMVLSLMPVAVFADSTKGTKDSPYTREEFSTMTRTEYIAAQEELGGIMYVDVGNYSYETTGTLGNGTTDNSDKDSTKLNYYAANGYRDERNDGANDKTVVFIGKSITSGVTGYASIDNIGTSLVLAVPAYTNVRFEGITFNNVFSFAYQLYTSPWSQLSNLTFDNCTFNGIIVGGLASNALEFNKCTFNNYTNTIYANNSNPTWIRPAYGNWTKGDNEVQGEDFKSLTSIKFTDNTVTSTRPVKFERIAQWDMDTTVTATGNHFDISKQDGDTSTKNVGMYLGANSKFDLVAEGNRKSDNTAALFTAVYQDANGKSQAGLPSGSTVKNTAGEDVTITDALEWKTNAALTLKTTGDESAVATIGGVGYASLAEAIAAAEDGDTVALLADVTEDVVINKNITLDLGGKTLTGTKTASKATLTIAKGATATVKNGIVLGTANSYYTIQNNGTATFEDIIATAGNTGSSMIDNFGTLTINSGTYTGGLNVVKCEEDSYLNITDGEFVANYSSYMNAVIWNYGIAAISGGTFIQNATGRSNPMVVLTGYTEGHPSMTTVTGGTFKNNNTTSARASIFWAYSKATGDNFAVSGGSFNKTIEAKYCAEGFIPSTTKNADGMYGVKEGKYVASIGSKNYETLAEAINNGAKKIVKLLSDVDENVTIKAGTTRTIDLNGYTLNGGTGTYTPTILNRGTLTITDSSADKTGTIKRKDKGIEGEISYYVIENNGTMTIENAIVTNNSGYKKTNPSGSMVGSSLICNEGTDATGTAAAKIAVLNIKGGTFTQYNFIAVKNSSNAELNVSGGVINSNHSAVQNWYKANITGGELNGQLWTDAWEETSTGKTVVSGDAKLNGEIVMDITGSIVPTLEISGGSHNVTWKVTTAAAKAGAKPQVSDGTFKAAVPEDYCADGFIPTKNEDGTYTVKSGSYVAETGENKYETLEEAINAAKSGATVTMLADTRENVTIAKKLTLDLNGFTINGGQVEGKATIKVDNASVTIQDSSAGQTGTIMREDAAENSGVSSYYVIDIQGKSGFLKFNGGNVINNSGTKTGEGASLVRLGDDKVAGAYPTLTINDGTFTQDNFIAIKVGRGTLHFKGGVITSANSYAIENWNNAYIKGGTVNGTVSTWVYSTGAAFSKLEIWDGTVNGDVASVNYDSAADKQARIYVKGGTVTGTLGTYTYANGLVPTDETAMATIEVTAGTFKKNPAKYVVEGSAVKTNDDGTFGVEKAYLAKVGETSYYTMDEAFHAALDSGEPLCLLRDYTTNSPQNSGSKNLTIDLGGHTWTYTGTDTDCAAFEINFSDVTLTVKNGTVISNSMVGLIPSAMNSTITYNNSALVFEGVTMTANGHSGIETNGSNTNDNVTLINSTLNVPNGYGIYFPSSGTLTINNSVINAKTMGVQVCAGSLNIVGENSAITVSDGPVEKTENDGAIEDGAAISVIYRPGYKALETVKVEAGRFTSKTGNNALKAYEWKDMTESAFDNTKGTIAVSGGTFTTAVSEDYCADGFIPTQNEDGSYGVKEGEYVAQVLDADGNFVQAYETLAEAFDNVETGYTVRLLKNITLTEQINIVKALNGLTLDGNGYTITCATTTDPMQSGGSALYFGNANDKLYCTGIKIKDLTMEGTARFAIFLCGGTSTEFTNVKISGNYYIAVNLYGTHGAVMTNCDISNSNTITTDKYVSAIWSNVSSANPLVLNNTKVSSIAINTYTTANKLEPKIFVNDGSVTEVHTFDDGTVSGNRKLCVSPDSTGEYTIRIYDAENTKWIPIPQYTVTTTVSPAGAGVLTGGGAYEEGTEVTITATANGGYEFLGWYKGGERVSQNATYTFKVSANADFVAMFKGTTMAKLSVDVGRGDVGVTYNGISDTWYNDIRNNEYAVGTEFTLTAQPYSGFKFLYWINSEGRILTEETTYSFMLAGDNYIKACYAKESQATKNYVVFIDGHSDKVLWSGDVSASVGTVSAPATLSYIGYNFVGWFDNDDAQYIPDATTGLITVTGDVVLRAKYVSVGGAYTVTVNGNLEENTYEYGAVVELVADEKDESGNLFAGWYLGDTLVCDTLTYRFVISGNVELTVKYTESGIVRQPITGITVSERATNADGIIAVRFGITWSLPEGYRLAEVGTILTFTDAQKDNLTLDSVDNTVIYKRVSKITDVSSGSYGFTANMKAETAKNNAYARGYITYQDVATGALYTIYTDVAVSRADG